VAAGGEKGERKRESAPGRAHGEKGERSREAARETVAHAAGERGASARLGAEPVPPSARDPFSGGLRRRDVLPLLVLHEIAKGPSYGNQLMERIARLTAGVLSVNPNTMYPLLRQLESRGHVEGGWEHPERRTRRFYTLTPAGEAEYRRLVEEVRPFLDSVRSSIDEIVQEVYGG
jgi:PadR family transcriptional regulator, regulatory protein PadR